MAYLRLIPMLALLVLLGGCGGATASAPTAPVVATSAPAAAYPNTGTGSSAASSDATRSIETAPAAGGTQQTPLPPLGRMVIKNANLSLEVADVAAAEAQIRASAERLGGYVVSAQTNGAEVERTSLIAIRVPSERFDQALAGAEGLAHTVLSRTVGGDDVTEEFVDLGSRLRNLEATRARLLDLLSRADTTEAALQVNQAVTDVQGQIEQIQGRMQYLQQSAAFSTITVQLQPIPLAAPVAVAEGWQPLLIAQNALAGLVGFGQALLSVAIVLAVWTPLWLPLLLLLRWAAHRFGEGRTARS